MADLSFLINKEPEDIVKWFRGKGDNFTWHWQEMWGDAHSKAFTVAKVMQADILQDIRSMVDKALAEGITFNEFQKTLKPELKKKGWWGEHIDTETGEVSQLGSPHRLRTIYRTNLSTAYNAGRWRSLEANKAKRPWLMYVAVLDDRTRPQHAEHDGEIYAIDDPFWQWFYPPNGWGCRCRARAVSEAWLKRNNRGGRISGTQIGISENKQGLRVATFTNSATGRKFRTDPGWAYNPGQTSFKPPLNAYNKGVQDQLNGAINE
jgi:SPP1 gp7 family putative phage head morphogenesis protein